MKYCTECRTKLATKKYHDSYDGKTGKEVFIIVKFCPKAQKEFYGKKKSILLSGNYPPDGLENHTFIVDGTEGLYHASFDRNIYKDLYGQKWPSYNSGGGGSL